MQTFKEWLKERERQDEGLLKWAAPALIGISSLFPNMPSKATAADTPITQQAEDKGAIWQKVSESPQHLVQDGDIVYAAGMAPLPQESLRDSRAVEIAKEKAILQAQKNIVKNLGATKIFNTNDKFIDCRGS